MSYPDGDEDDLWALGDAWKAAAKELEGLIPDVKAATDSTQQFYSGEGSEKALAEFAKLFDSGDHSLYTLVKGLEDLGERTREAGTEVEYTKIMEAGFAALTAYSVYALIAAWPWGSAAVPAAIAAGREAISLAAEQGARQLAMQMAKAGLRNAAKVYLKDIAITGLKVGAQGLALDLGIQGYQVLADHRNSIDPAQAARTALEWGVGGAVARGVAPGFTKILGHTPLSPASRGFLGGGLSGLAGGFGMYGTDIAWQVGDQLVHGNLDWSKVNTTLNPAMLAAGFGLGAAHGVRAAAKPGGTTHLPEGTSPHPSGGKPDVVTLDTSHSPDTAKSTASVHGEGAPAEARDTPGGSHSNEPTNIREESRPSHVVDGPKQSAATPASTETRSGVPDPRADAAETHTGAANSPTRVDTATADHGKAAVSGDRTQSTAPADSAARSAPTGERSPSVTPSDRTMAPRDSAPTGQPAPGDRAPSRAGAPATPGDRPSNITAGQHDRPAPSERPMADTQASAPPVERVSPSADKPSTTGEPEPGRQDEKAPNESEHDVREAADNSPGGHDSGSIEGAIDPSAKTHDGAAFDAAHEKSAENGRTPEHTQECGDPVDVATGEFLLPETDLSLPGVLALVLKRRHRSNYRFGRWFGPSWSATLDMRLVVSAQGVSFIGEDGVLLAYPHPVTNAPVIPLTGLLRWTLTRTDAGVYNVWDPEQERTWYFAPATGHAGVDSQLGTYAIAAISDRHGNHVHFDYDIDGNPTEITHSGGYRVRVATADGRVTGLAVADGESFVLVKEFGYAAGQLVRVTNAAGATTSYAYDDHRMVSWTDSNGNHLANGYDESGQVVRQLGPSGVLNAEFDYLPAEDGSGSVTIHTDSLGARTTFRFDSTLRLCELVDPLGYRTTVAYGVDRRPVRVVAPDGATTLYSYTEHGDIARITRPDGRHVEMEYHAGHRPSRITDADGTVRIREWDTNGNLIAVVDPSGARTAYSYHRCGAIATITEPNGATTQITVNSAGLPIRAIDPLGAETTVEHDDFGRTIRVTDAIGEQIHYRWSSNSQLLQRITADGKGDRWTYDGEGNVLTHTNPAGSTTRSTYGAFDLLASRIDPNGAVTTYTWDTERRLSAVTNPNGETWHYTYDSAGRLALETDFAGATTCYERDSAGRTISITPATGVTRYHGHDVLGRLTTITTDAGDWIEYTHDTSGRLLRATNGHSENLSHTLEFTYTLTGQLASQQLDDQPAMRFDHDVLGRRVRRTTPSGAETRWYYDYSGRTSGLSADGHDINFTYDPTGRLARWQLGEVAVDSIYDHVGRVVRKDVLANPVRLLNLGFDSAPRIAPEQLRSDEYTWRSDGYVTRHATRYSNTAAIQRDYELDSLGRVTSLTGTGTDAERYTYDALGNIVGDQSSALDSSATAATVVAEFDAARTPEAPRRNEFRGNLLIRDGRTQYTYDASGRLIRKVTTRISRKADVWHYRYNSLDQLTDVWTPGRQWWHYTYDAFGRRISRQHLATDGTVLEQVDYTWDGTHLTEQVTSQTTTRWHYQPGTYTPLTQSDQSAIDRQFYAIVTDLVGSPVELIDPTTAQSVARASTLLWGLTVWRGEAATPLRFPGQIEDPETGLHYNFFRTYDPVTGRFLTQDPLGLAPAPNPNTYPHNPLTWLDPLGLTPCSPGTQDDALLALNRAEELQSTRNDYFMADQKGTTAVIGVFDTVTRQFVVRIGINGSGSMPANWVLKPGEQFVQAPGHAEEGIINSLGPNEVAVYGAASRNFCLDICLPMIDGNGIEIGGVGIRGHSAQNSAYTIFWTK
ncbi:DUF6531 domain-containing protein [Nocardia sp. NPDC056100]|uniref:DUF6531 domain-containing protein n=1 Tax=Nocardia sp. NPDC056100 TaxID=3345712 RepID=UPI0035D7D0DA